MRQLDATATAAALPWAPLIEGLADLCRAHAAGQVACPPRQVLPLQSGGSLLVMPAVGPELAITKLVTVHPDNPARGLPTILGEVVVMDSASGARLATTAVNRLHSTGGRYALCTMCIGVGQGIALIIERV